MAAKYPTIAFTARDSQQLLEVLKEHLSGTDVIIRLSPTKGDNLRLIVVATGFRKVVPIGAKARVEVIRYVPGKGQHSIDRIIFDALWELVSEVDSPPELWGTYTELFPGLSPSRQ